MTSHQDRQDRRLDHPVSAKDYEREAEHTRQRLAENLDQLTDRLTPGQVFDEVLTYSRAGGGTFYRALSNAMRDNPMPSLLIGAGCMMFLSEKMGLRAGMLAGAARASGSSGNGAGAAGRVPDAAGRISDAGGRMTRSAATASRDTAASFAAGVQQTAASRASNAAGAVSESMRRTGAAASDTLSTATGAASDAVRQTVAGAADRLAVAADAVRATTHDLRGSGAEVVGRVRDQARGAMDAAGTMRDSMRDTASSMSGRLADTTDRTRRAASSFITEQPLVSAAIGVAIGAAIASLLPRSEAEDALMGDASDRMKGAAGDVAGEALVSARSVAGKVAERAQSAAREEGFTPSAVADAARNLGEGIHKGVIREPMSGSAPQALADEELVDVKRTWP